MYSYSGLFSNHNSLRATLICEHIKAWLIAMHAMMLCLLFSRVEQELWEIFKKINQYLATHHQSYFPYSSQERFIESERVSSVAGATIYM